MKRALIFLCVGIFIALVLQPNLAQSKKSDEVRVPQVSENAPVTNEDVTPSVSTSKIRIGIDAGHGGDDLGYVGSGTAEKDINLAIAQTVGRKLQAAGYEVVYTRTDDNVPSGNESTVNSQRLSDMQAQNVDILLSFAAGNASDPLMKGFTIFTRPDEKTTALANEIGQELVSINFSTFEGVDTDHYSNFSILANKQVPTIYIELGYLSNKDDYSNLIDPDYQDKIGQAVTNAFLNEVD